MELIATYTQLSLVYLKLMTVGRLAKIWRIEVHAICNQFNVPYFKTPINVINMVGMNCFLRDKISYSPIFTLMYLYNFG